MIFIIGVAIIVGVYHYQSYAHIMNNKLQSGHILPLCCADAFLSGNQDRSRQVIHTGHPHCCHLASHHVDCAYPLDL